MIFDDPKQAAESIKKGQLVLFPTETVWGIGANALDHEACRQVYKIKGRPSDNPLIIHLHSVDQVKEIAYIKEAMLAKLSEWMPGPLTLILKKKKKSVFSCGLDTVGVRIPDNKVAMEMIRLSGTYVAAPSANVSGKPSITRFSDIVEEFDGMNVLRGEDSSLGLESTVIDLTQEDPIYLRPGMITFEELQEVLPTLKVVEGISEKPLSPGMKYRHYAPNCQVIIVDSLEEVQEPKVSAQIGFDLTKNTLCDVQVVDNKDYAKKLYAFLIECDRRGVKKAWCQKPEDKSLFHTLIHRLEKASLLK